MAWTRSVGRVRYTGRHWRRKGGSVSTLRPVSNSQGRKAHLSERNLDQFVYEFSSAFSSDKLRGVRSDLGRHGLELVEPTVSERV